MIPILISAILTCLSFVAIFMINTSSSICLTDSQFINSTIAILACLGGFISATFVIYSYIQTNKAFLIGLKPSLLIQVASENNQTTLIHYTNTSNNEFIDLTIVLDLKIGNKKINLNDLFKAKMSMAAHDKRHKRINTCNEVNQRGIDLNKEVNSGNNAILITSYTYSFNEKIETRIGAEYKWNISIQQWELI